MTMSETLPAPRKSVPWFQIFKYSVYSLLLINLIMFLVDDWRASSHLFANGISLGQLIEGYAATIDTASWVILLLVFELETWVISDDKLKGGIEWWLGALKLLCYAAIVYAFYGYVTKFLLMHSFELSPVIDLCTRAANGLSFMTDLDDYDAVSLANCSALGGTGPLYQLPASTIVSSETGITSAQWLALIDVVNAADWLLIVCLLTLEIRLQMNGRLSRALMKGSAFVKAVLYSLLLVCAVLWGIDGDFLDFWDAFLWIVAFAFIELNLFEWHAETEGEALPLGVHSAKG